MFYQFNFIEPVKIGFIRVGHGSDTDQTGWLKNPIRTGRLGSLVVVAGTDLIHSYF